MSNNPGIDTWGVISGAIGVLTVLPLLWGYIKSQHPETKLAELDSILKDTEALFRSVVEEGLLHPEHHVPHFESNLKVFRAKTEKIREETFIATIEWRKLFRAWLGGLSKRIGTLCGAVKEVRVDICETSAAARTRLMQRTPGGASPTESTWRTKIAMLWRRVLSFVYKKSAPSIPAASPDNDVIVASSTDSERSSSAKDASCTCAPCYTHRPSRKAHARCFKSRRASSRLSATASHAHELHVLARAIRRMNRDLTAQGATNTTLTQLVQATHKRWSPASSKAYVPRRPRGKRHPSIPRLETRPALQRVSDLRVHSDSFGEETTCEV